MPVPSLPRLELGAFEVLVLRDGFLSVDAGDMFGAPAKAGRLPGFEVAGEGRLAIALNSFLIRTGSENVLVDTGVGWTLDGPLGAHYSFKREPGLFEALRTAGLGPEDIDVVINTHLHFDHCGGNTEAGEGGAYRAAFPKAEYVIQSREYGIGIAPPPGEAESYVRETFLPLESGFQILLVDGDEPVRPGIEVRLSPGHTGGHQSVKVTSEGRTLLILGDLVPTSIHVAVRSVGYDLDPTALYANKRRLFEEGLRGGWIYGFVHDALHPFGRVERPGERFAFRPLEAPAG